MCRQRTAGTFIGSDNSDGPEKSKPNENYNLSLAGRANAQPGHLARVAGGEHNSALAATPWPRAPEPR